MDRRDRALEVARVIGRVLTDEAVLRLRAARRGEPVPGQEDRRQARAVKEALERLGPLYIKVGQILSTRPDLVSAAVIEELSVFHERALVQPFSRFEPVLEANLGRRWRDRFADIDTPLGAGSMAQVYRATLRRGGAVVLKIQRPGVAHQVALDMEILTRAIRIVSRTAPGVAELFQPEAMLETIFSVMRPEVDFTVEADNIDDLRDVLDGYSHIGVPEVVGATREVLMMTMASGSSVLTADMARFTRDERRAMAKDLVAMAYKGLMVDGIFHADPHPGNIFVAPGQPATLIDFGMVGRLDRRLSLGLTRFMMALGARDGQGAGRAALELSNPTPRADVPAFLSDMQRWVPSRVGSSLGELNFGRTFNEFLLLLTRRGIAVNPSVAIIGKTLLNLDGSVRMIAPEVKPTEIFRGVLGEILRAQFRQENGRRPWLRDINEVGTGLRDLSAHLGYVSQMAATGSLVLKVAPDQRALGDRRARRRSRALHRTLVSIAGVILLDRRATRRARGLP